MSHIYDAAIIGAGPAGLTAAIELARVGWKVLLIEKSAFPRFKVCGGFIGPENKIILEHYGLLNEVFAAGGQKVTHIHLSAPNGKAVRVPLRFSGKDDFGLGISRKKFDELLLARAVEAGVTFYDYTVMTKEIYEQQQFTLTIKRRDESREETVNSRQLIYANGAHSVTSTPSAKLFGVSGFFNDCQGLGSDVAMHFIHEGHVGINRFEEDRVNVCYVIKESLFQKCQGKYEKIWDNFLQNNPVMREQVAGAQLISPWKAVCVDLNTPLRFFDGRSFYAGDAAGLIHPVSGGGISLALQAGMLLGQLLATYAPKNVPTAEVAKTYEILWRKYFYRSCQISKIIGRLSHQELVANQLVHLLAWQQQTVHRLFDLLHRPSPLASLRRFV